MGYSWPGNVRQLESRIKRAVIMAEGVHVEPEDLAINQQQESFLQLDDATEEFKLQYVRAALDRNDWNRTQTAKELGVDPRTVFRYIERLPNPRS